MGNTHTLSDHRKHEKRREDDGEERESIYRDIQLLMSAPPLGSFSLTFMLDHSIALFFSYSYRLLPVHSFSFTHYPVSFPFAPHESHTLAFAASAVAIVWFTHPQRCKRTRFAHIRFAPSLLQYAARVRCVKTSSSTINSRSFLLSPSEEVACRANQARASAVLKWIWEFAVGATPAYRDTD